MFLLRVLIVRILGPRVASEPRLPAPGAHWTRTWFWLSLHSLNHVLPNRLKAPPHRLRHPCLSEENAFNAITSSFLSFLLFALMKCPFFVVTLMEKQHHKWWLSLLVSPQKSSFTMIWLKYNFQNLRSFEMVKHLLCNLFFGSLKRNIWYTKEIPNVVISKMKLMWTAI